MTPKEALIDALRALCKREGGYKAVALVIKSNPQTIYQIVAGVKLPSGEPRGVGAQIQKKLEKHFPGWSHLRTESSWPREREQPDRRKQVLSMLQAIEHRISGLNKIDKNSALSAIAEWCAGKYDAAEVASHIEKLLGTNEPTARSGEIQPRHGQGK